MITDQLTELLLTAVSKAKEAGELSLPEDFNVVIRLEMPPDKRFGDYSSNLALALKRAANISDSRQIAAILCKYLPEDSPLLEKTEVAGPGFINLYLKPDWLLDTMLLIEEQDQCYGTSVRRAGEKILIEFVSANPTGPISVVNGRAAALGDVLANLLCSQGCEVSREFYINDALNSRQIEMFATTVQARYLQQFGHPLLMPDGHVEAGLMEKSYTDPISFPENGYPGEYVVDIARSIAAEVGDVYVDALVKIFQGKQVTESAEDATKRTDYFRRTTLDRMIDAQKGALKAFGVEYDNWFYESSLYENGDVEKVISLLGEKGYTYTKDGALWLKSSELGDTEDRVLVRSNEKATYIAADAAYHANKFSRGYTHVIDIFGADHHGYVARLKASVAALGYKGNELEVILTQLISLVRDGVAVIGGKRKGVILELKEDLIDDIGKDASRFYFLLNSYETPATVDVELAKKQSNDNPVFYVQYAHARLCNILARAEELGATFLPAKQVDRSLLTHPQELDMLRKLADYPEELALSAEKVAPHRLTRYAMDLAGLLNLFYENCRVLPSKENPQPEVLTTARLALVNSARIVLRNLLTMLGISAPERMDRTDTL